MQEVIFNEELTENELTLSKAVSLMAEDATAFVSVVKAEDLAECDKVVRHTTMAMQRFANSHFKSVAGLEARDVEQIKDALRNFRCDDARAKEVKEAIIEDLTEFQTYIRKSNINIIAENKKQIEFCKKQLMVAEVEKNKLIMARLSKIAWPYDAKTKAYDNKIAALEAKIEYHQQKIATAKINRPMASEKDILVYGAKLKEKYLKTA